MREMQAKAESPGLGGFQGVVLDLPDDEDSVTEVLDDVEGLGRDGFSGGLHLIRGSDFYAKRKTRGGSPL